MDYIRTNSATLNISNAASALDAAERKVADERNRFGTASADARNARDRAEALLREAIAEWENAPLISLAR